MFDLVLQDTVGRSFHGPTASDRRVAGVAPWLTCRVREVAPVDGLPGIPATDLHLAGVYS